MNCETLKMFPARLVAVCLSASVVLSLSPGPVSADTLIVNSPLTTNFIQVPRFNELANQGWLTNVSLQVNLTSNSTVNSTGNHTHSLSIPLHFGGSTSTSGLHSHAINIPTFSGSGLSLVPVNNFNVSIGGLHGHSVNSAASSTNAAGSHNHSHFTRTLTHLYSGGGVTPFLGSGTFGLNGPLSATATVGSHNHSFSVGVSGAGAHGHGYTDRWTTNTTFTFNANDAPIANTNGNYNLVYGDALLLSGLGSSDVDAPFGDFITQYQWDLDNDSSPDITTVAPSISLSEVAYAAYFTTPGTHTIGLRVRDSLNQYSTYNTTSVIIPFTPGDGNGDGKVDGLDYLIWAANFADDPADDPPGSPENGDFNDDSVVNGLDYLLWASNFGQGQNDATAVPEPGSLLLLIVGLTCSMAGRRRAG